MPHAKGSLFAYFHQQNGIFEIKHLHLLNSPKAYKLTKMNHMVLGEGKSHTCRLCYSTSIGLPTYNFFGLSIHNRL